MARIAKELDLVGNRVGRLLVVSRGEDKIRTKNDGYTITNRYWVCSCDCGNSREVRQDAILAGTSKSCGCLRDESAKENVKKAYSSGFVRQPENLIGQVFGGLTVIESAPRSVTPKGRELVRWLCSCRCGGTIDVLHDSLKRGSTLTCGCVSAKSYNMDLFSANEEFIYKARLVHGDLYDYSDSEYKHSQENIKIACKIHGQFEQRPSNHLVGSGCTECKNLARRLTLSSFLERVEAVHGTTYDYSLADLVSAKSPVKIICESHGIFIQNPSDHLSGRGCPECGNLRRFVGLDDFIKRSNEVHNYKFDYSKSVYEHSTKKIEIICKVHGSFFQQPAGHLLGHQCPKCSGEERALKQHWNYIKRCELSPELAESEGCLYLLEMTHENETFLKVGISNNFSKRISRYREEGISFNVLSEIKGTAVQTAIWERDILKDIRDNGFRYLPKVSFKGWTECAVVEATDYTLDLFRRVK